MSCFDQAADKTSENTAASAWKPPNTEISYSSLGDGFECQPPSRYPSVTRGMALETADRYPALLTFPAENSVYESMIVRCSPSSQKTPYMKA